MSYLGSGVLAVAMVAAAVGTLLVGPDYLNNSESVTESRQSSRNRAVSVVAEPVVLLPERTRIEAVGTSRALRSVTLHPAASGTVVAVHFSADQHVAAGTVLVELDARDAALALELAQVRVAEAERLLRRYEGTRGSGAFSVSAIDEARSALDAARIERDRARVALDDRSIEAPFAGHVGITETDPGDRVHPDTTIATLDDRSVLLVSFEIPEAFLDQIQVGQQLSVATWNRRSQAAQGRIVQIGSRIDPASRTFTARAEVSNPGDRLRPGMSFRVTLDLEGISYPVVPEVAVQWGGDGAYVWTVKNGNARRVAVDIVQRREGRVLVDAELPEGIPVVVEGVQRMREELAVEWLNADAAVKDETLARTDEAAPP